MDAFALAVVAGLLGGPIAGGAAAFVGRLAEDRVGRGVHAALLAFAGGFILSVAFLELLGRGLGTASGWQVLLVVGGLAAGALVRWAVTVSVERREPAAAADAEPGSEAERRHGHVQAKEIATSLAVVNLIEGLPVGVGFTAGRTLGFLIAAVMIFENFTEALSIATELSGTGTSTRRLVWLTAGPTSVLGVGAGVGALIGDVSPTVSMTMFGAAAGIMLYVVVDDIVLDAHRLGPGAISTFPLLFGVVLGALLVTIAEGAS